MTIEQRSYSVNILTIVELLLNEEVDDFLM